MEFLPKPFDAEPDRGERLRVERARGGDRGAQEELLRLHYARIHGTAFKLLGNPEDAEDLAQECFIKAFRSLAFYRGEGSFAGWLRRILVHLAQDRFRAQGRRAESAALPLEILRELAGASSEAREPQRELEGRELAAHLDDALRALDVPLRTALLLRTRESLDYEEIATLTGVTPATARTRVMKARKVLARLLAPYLARREERRTP